MAWNATFMILWILLSTTGSQNVTDPRCSVWKGMDFAGHDLMGVNRVTSPDECNNLCRADDVCTFWTWVVDQQKCWLKNSDTGFPTRPRRHNSAFSGFSRCVSECKFPELDFRGEDYSAIDNVLSGDECQVHCAADSTCQFWTYAFNAGPANQKCHKKRNGLGIPQNIYKHTGTVSGFPTCPGAFIGPRPNCKCI